MEDDKEKLNGDCCAPSRRFSWRFSHRAFDEVKRAAKRLCARVSVIYCCRSCATMAREINELGCCALVHSPRGGGAYCHFLPSQKASADKQLRIAAVSLSPRHNGAYICSAGIMQTFAPCADAGLTRCSSQSDWCLGNETQARLFFTQSTLPLWVN